MKKIDNTAKTSVLKFIFLALQFSTKAFSNSNVFVATYALKKHPLMRRHHLLIVTAGKLFLVDYVQGELVLLFMFPDHFLLFGQRLLSPYRIYARKDIYPILRRFTIFLCAWGYDFLHIV